MLEIIHQLEQIDTQVFLFFNGMHCEFFDYFMMMASHRFIWIPFYAAFVWVMICNFHWKVTLTTILAVALLILLCDQTASGLLKPMVERLRPSNLDNPISPLVHVVNDYRGGRYGFPSSHSANSWGAAFFAMYLARSRKLNIFLMIWASVISYSRTYLGVHYPGDLLVGMLIGFTMATIVFLVYQFFFKSYTFQFYKHEERLKQDYIPITIGIASFAIMLLISGVMCYII